MALSAEGLLLLVRGYSGRLVCANKFSITTAVNAKPGYFLHKLIAKHKTKVPNDYAFIPCSSGIPSTPRKPQEITRRQRALNAVFMENISDIMFSGEIGDKLRGRGIELTEVRVSSDCTHLNVYWVTSLNRSGVEEEIAKLLASCSGFLRTELISCQFMGRVPKITFVHDVNFGRVSEVQKMIEEIYEKIPQQEKDDVTSPELDPTDATACNEVAHETQERLMPHVPPYMKMDVLGLDHAALMREVTGKMKRARGELRGALPESGAESSALGTVAAVQHSRVTEFIQHQKQKQLMSKKMEQRAERALQRFCNIDKDGRDKQSKADIPQIALDYEQEDEYDEEEVTKVSYLDDQSSSR